MPPLAYQPNIRFLSAFLTNTASLPPSSQHASAQTPRVQFHHSAGSLPLLTASAHVLFQNLSHCADPNLRSA